MASELSAPSVLRKQPLAALIAREGGRIRLRPGRRRVLPYSTFSRKLVGNERIPARLLAASSQAQIDVAKQQVIDILRRRRHVLAGDDDNFAVRDPREMQAVLQSVTGMLTSVLAGVAAISPNTRFRRSLTLSSSRKRVPTCDCHDFLLL